jgi:hypothetical protein
MPMSVLVVQLSQNWSVTESEAFTADKFIKNLHYEPCQLVIDDRRFEKITLETSVILNQVKRQTEKIFINFFKVQWLLYVPPAVTY